MVEITANNDEIHCEKLELQARKIWIDNTLRDGRMRGQLEKTVRGFVRKGLSQQPLKLHFSAREE